MRTTVQAVQQVGVELAALHLASRIPVRGGDDAHVWRRDQPAYRRRGRTRLGQHAQQARLQQQRHVADLVQEHACRRRSVRSAARWRRVAPVKVPARGRTARPRKLGRNRCGIECDEGLAGARAARAGRATSSLPVPVSPVMSTLVGGGDAADGVEHPRAAALRPIRSSSSPRRAGPRTVWLAASGDGVVRRRHRLMRSKGFGQVEGRGW